MANSVVFGVFSTKEQVETAVAEMKREGFRNADILERAGADDIASTGEAKGDYANADKLPKNRMSA